LQEARRQFEQAIELDPEYAEAYVALAECNLLLAINHNALPREDALQVARDNLDEALRLNPELSDAYATEGLLKTNIWTQTRIGPENAEAEIAFEYAISLNPNNAQAYMWFASLRAEEQRYEDSIGLYHRSMRLDPLARVPYSNLPTLYAQLGQNDVAVKLWLKAIEIHPEWPTPYQLLATHLMGMGRLDEAYAWNLISEELGSDATAGGNIGVAISLQFGDLDKARELFTRLPANHPLASMGGGLQLWLDEDYPGALDFFVRNLDQDESPVTYLLDIASDIALLAGDYETAREFVLRRMPILESDADLQVDRYSVRQLVTLAFVHQSTGNVIRGNEMLLEALPVVRSLPASGLFGQGLREVQILALLGRREDALQALQAAVAGGLRTSILANVWLLEDDPYLVSIRDDPRFLAVLDELETLNELMHTRVMQAEESGNWDALRALAGSS